MQKKNLCIAFSQIQNYIKELSRNYEIYFPVKSDDQIIFTNDLEQINNFYPDLSAIPPKEFFLPTKEIISEFDHSNNQKITSHNQKKKILFGVHPFDVKAISILDDILINQNPDFYYQRRRKNFFIISIGKFSFIDNFNCDLYLENNGDTYEVYLKNPKADFLLDYPQVFSNSKFEYENKIYVQDKLFANPEKLARAIEYSYQNNIWDELAKVDLCCGNCTFVCPLCYCFNLEDNFCFANNQCKSQKCRTQTTCFNPNFFNTNSKDFRKKRRDRIYNWYHHKFVRMPRQTGHMGCIDCGRCIKSCPANINFKQVLKTILDDYEKYLQS